MPVRLGVVGINYWGPNLARNFDRLAGAELAWCCDLDEALLERHRPAFPTSAFTTDLDDLLGDDTLDVDSGKILHTAKLMIELKVGPSKITITPMGITLNAPTITLQAAGPISIQGLPVKIN